MDDRETLCYVRNLKDNLRGALQTVNILWLDGEIPPPLRELTGQFRSAFPGFLDKLTVISDTLCLRMENQFRIPKKSELLFTFDEE